MYLLYYFPESSSENLRGNATASSEINTHLLSSAALAGLKVERFAAIEAFIHRLRCSLYDISGAVLVIVSRSDMNVLIQHLDLLEDFSIWIILDSDDAELLSLAYTLYPRGISFLSDNSDILQLVLRRYIKKLKQDEKYLPATSLLVHL